MEDATPKGAEETTEEKPKVRTLADIRAEQTEAIADRRNEEIVQDNLEEEPEKKEPPVEAKEPVDEIKEPVKPEKVKIKVDGQEMEVPLDDVIQEGIKAKQKLSAADRRLQDATEQLRLAREERARAQLFRPPAPADATPKTEEKTEIDDNELDELAQVFSYGEKDEIKKALAKLREPGRQAPTLDDSKIAELVDARIAEREAKAQETERVERFRKINEKFEAPPDSGGFKDLLEDAAAKELVLKEIDYQLASGKPNTWETYETVGKTIREFLDSRKKYVKPETVVTDLEQRRARKKAIDTITPASGRDPAPAAEPKKQTPSQVIEEMRRSRPGQRV